MAFSPGKRGLLLGLLLFVAPAVALAEPSAADKETARRLMAEGRDKRGANDLKGALQSFIAADSIMRVPTTGLEVARTQAQLGQLLEARDTALRVARSSPEGEEPAPFKKARDDARELSDDLAKRIPTITVQVVGADPGAAPNVTVDGSPIPAASLGMPRTVDPGHHVVVAAAGGRQGRVELDILEAQQKDAKVELREAAASAGPGSLPVGEADKAGGSHAGTPLMIGGAIVGGAGLVLGTVTGIVSLTKTSSIKNQCQVNRCPSSQQSDIDSARTMATISNVGFIVGGVGAAVAIVGFFMWRGERHEDAKPAAAALRVRPWIGVGSAGMTGSF